MMSQSEEGELQLHHDEGAPANRKRLRNHEVTKKRGGQVGAQHLRQLGSKSIRGLQKSHSGMEESGGQADASDVGFMFIVALQVLILIIMNNNSAARKRKRLDGGGRPVLDVNLDVEL